MGYYEATRQRTILGGAPVSLHTKPGMVLWDDVEMSASLLAEAVELRSGARVLVLESGHGALAVWAARQGADVHCFDGSLVAARMTRLTLAANDAAAQVYEQACPQASQTGTYDVALLVIPKGRAYARALMGAAFRALKTGARLYLAGPNAGGAKAIVKDAGTIFGRSATLTTKARSRVGVAVKLAGAPGEAAPGEAYHEFEAAGLKLFSTPGVFSWDGLDDGTTRLLDTLHARLCGGARVLDVACGYGVIGFVAAKLGAAAVDLVDSSWLAVDCAACGIHANWLDEICRVWASDLYSDVAGEPYDLICSNPPFHMGHAVETTAAIELIRGARERLVKGGRLRIVANTFLAYQPLMADVFGRDRVSVIQEDTRYRVLEAIR